MVGKMMQLTGIGRFELTEVALGEPGAGQVLLDVEAVTTCPQWDMHLWRGEPMFAGTELNYPLMPGIPGHEVVGRVAALGRDVSALDVGQRVAAWRALPMDRPGAYGTHVIHDADRLLAIPESDPTTAWASLELAMCVAGTMLDLRDHGFLPCRRFGVSGLGPSGLIACQIAKAIGVAEVIAFDLDERRRKLAADHGWAHAMDPADADSSMMRGQSNALDVAVDCVGSAKVISFLSDRTNDVVALFGVQREDYIFRPHHGVGPALRLWGYPGHHLAAGRFAHELIRKNQLNLKPLVTHTVRLADYNQAVELLISGQAIKVCLQCDDASI